MVAIRGCKTDAMTTYEADDNPARLDTDAMYTFLATQAYWQHSSTDRATNPRRVERRRNLYRENRQTRGLCPSNIADVPHFSKPICE